MMTTQRDQMIRAHGADHVLAMAWVDTQGRVVTRCSDPRVRPVIIAEGATEVGGDLLELDLGLTILAAHYADYRYRGYRAGMPSPLESRSPSASVEVESDAARALLALCRAGRAECTGIVAVAAGRPAYLLTFATPAGVARDEVARLRRRDATIAALKQDSATIAARIPSEISHPPLGGSGRLSADG
jgi:hypothetical protein